MFKQWRLPPEQTALMRMALGRTTVVLMQTKLANGSSRERYVVEIDGITKSEYSVFVKALTASLQLKQEFPHNSVKLRDADEKAPLHAY
jgi:hypothetical protein